MESFIKATKGESRAEAQERQAIAEFYALAETQRVFAAFDRALEQLFRFYAAQEKKEIGFDLAQRLSRVSFSEFVKFGFQTGITPSVVSNEDMVLVFRALVRERREHMTQQEVDELGSGVNSLAFDDFKRALVRIAVLGQALLGGAQPLEARLLD